MLLPNFEFWLAQCNVLLVRLMVVWKPKADFQRSYSFNSCCLKKQYFLYIKIYCTPLLSGDENKCKNFFFFLAESKVTKPAPWNQSFSPDKPLSVASYTYIMTSLATNAFFVFEGNHEILCKCYTLPCILFPSNSFRPQKLVLI